MPKGGEQTMRVGKFCNREVIIAEKGSTVTEVAKLMRTIMLAMWSDTPWGMALRVKEFCWLMMFAIQAIPLKWQTNILGIEYSLWKAGRQSCIIKKIQLRS